jgi:hypothetical protein
MTAIALTTHAAVRMAQRNIKIKDAELIMLIGTEVNDGFLVRTSDSSELEKLLIYLLQRVRRVRGKRLVVAEGRIVTAYNSSRSDQRRLLRCAERRNLRD